MGWGAGAQVQWVLAVAHMVHSVQPLAPQEGFKAQEMESSISLEMQG